MSEIIRRKNDLLWKGMLEEVFDDFLHFIFPRAEQLFDFRKGFEFLDKELNELLPEPTRASATRYVDKLVRVTRRNGRKEWLLIHIEVQDQNKPAFPARMFQYYYRIYDKYRRPVTAVAIFTGRSGTIMKDRYKHSCLGTRLEYVYNTLRITDYPDEVLEENINPFALVILAAKKALLPDKMPDAERLKHKLLVAKILLTKKSIPHKKVKAILTFLNNYVLFDDAQINSIFIKGIDQITNKAQTMGIIEQLAEIRAEETLENANRRFVESLLKKSDFSMPKIASLVGVPLTFVKKVKKELK